MFFQLPIACAARAYSTSPCDFIPPDLIHVKVASIRALVTGTMSTPAPYRRWGSSTGVESTNA